MNLDKYFNENNTQYGECVQKGIFNMWFGTQTGIHWYSRSSQYWFNLYLLFSMLPWGEDVVFPSVQWYWFWSQHSRLFVSIESPERPNVGLTKFIKVVRVIMEHPTPMEPSTCITVSHQLPGKILTRKQWGRAILTSYGTLWLYPRHFEDKNLWLRYWHTPTTSSRMLLLSPITPGYVGTVSVGVHLIQIPLPPTIANTNE